MYAKLIREGRPGSRTWRGAQSLSEDVSFRADRLAEKFGHGALT